MRRLFDSWSNLGSSKNEWKKCSRLILDMCTRLEGVCRGMSNLQKLTTPDSILSWSAKSQVMPLAVLHWWQSRCLLKASATAQPWVLPMGNARATQGCLSWQLHSPFPDFEIFFFDLFMILAHYIAL